MDRQRRTVLLVTLFIAAYLLLTTAVVTLNEVPTLDELPRPDYNFSLPDMDLPTNPEMTNLQTPELDLGNIDSEPLLSVLGKTGTEYLRLQTYDDYFSGTWDTALTDSITYEGETLNLDVDLWTNFNLHNITITPLTDNMGYIPTPSNPLSLNLSNPAQFFEDQQIFQIPDVPGAYEVEYILYEYSDALMNASNVENIPQYLDIPEYLDSDLRNLAEAITQNTTTDYEAITALESYLENYYNYNLSCPEPPPGTDPLEYFLYESGEGVCSHFNTALVMLARSLGFSARLVGGYYIDPLVEEQLVYPIQSHAFTEIPFDDLGWIIFDATPSAQIQDMIDEIPKMNLSYLTGDLEDMDFEFPEGEGPPQERLFKIYGQTGSPYLRDGVGEYYNGSWYQNPSLPIEYDGQVIESLISGYEIESENSFIVEPSVTLIGYLPGPQDPVQLELNANSTFYPELKLFKPDEPHSTRYQVSGNTYTFSEDTLINAEPYLLEPYLHIDETLDSRINALASDITRYEFTPYAKMEALTNYLQTSFPYNISAQPEPPDVDPIVWFLFYEQQGICTDFASTLTMLARSIGIPTRIVTGYLVNPYAEVQEVKPIQAHAYTEVLFDNIGWIIFDATPVASPEINDTTGLTPTFTNITHQDSTVSVGGEFIVAGTVIDELSTPVSGLEVLVYLKQEKTDLGMLSGQGVLIDGLFNVTCIFPPNLPAGEYMVDAHTIGDDTYLDSWSDPPLTAYSETSFIIQAPQKVISGRVYSVNATLVDNNTNKTIPLADCVASVNEDSYDLKTNQRGTVNLVTSSDEGTVSLGFSWTGTGYIHGADTSKTIESIPLQVSLPPETVLVRGERNIIRGQVKAEEIEGNLEPISISILGDDINSVTNEHGEFFIAKTVPESTDLGATPMIIEILNDHRTITEFALVKSRVKVTLIAPISGEANKKTGVKVSLTDDKGGPLSLQPVNITYTHQNTTINKEIFTDSTGIAETNLKLPSESGKIEVYANYPGKTNYLASSTSKAVTIISPTKFPLLQLSVAILLIGGVAGIFYLKGQRETKDIEIEDMELVNQAWSDQLSITLPEIEPDLPAVWDSETQLTIQGAISNDDQSPRTGETLSLVLNETVISSTPSDSDGIIKANTKISSLGVHRLTLIHTTDEQRTGLDIKIVDYRDEIIRLFNNRFKESRDMFQSIRDNYTARELYEYLKPETPEAAHKPLRELVFIFEEANYSLHEVKREHYTRFFREMRKYKEAQNGEDS